VATAENLVGDEISNIQNMHHPSSVVRFRDMDVTIKRLEEIGCFPSLMPKTHPPDKLVWPCSNQEVISQDRIIFHWGHHLMSSPGCLWTCGSAS